MEPVGRHINETLRQCEIVNLRVKKRHSPALAHSKGAVKGEIGCNRAGCSLFLPISTYFYLPLGSNIGDSWASSLCLQRKCQCVLPKPSHSHQQSHQPRTELDLGLHSDCDFRFPFGSMHSGQPAHTHTHTSLWMPSQAGRRRWPGSIPGARL